MINFSLHLASSGFLKLSFSFNFSQDIPNKSNHDNQIQIQDTSFDLKTSQFVGYNNTDRRFLDTFDVASGTFAQNANIYPDTFSNLQGRIMRIAILNY